MTRWLCLVVLLTAACTDANDAHRAAGGRPHLVELYSGGRLVATFESTSVPECGSTCDFKDAKTGTLVRLKGDIVVRVK